MSEISKGNPLAGSSKEIACNPETAGGHEAPPEPADLAAEAAQTDSENSTSIDASRLVTTAALMTYVSALAVTAEQSGYNDVLPHIPEMVANSLGHPALGYIGGGAAGLAAFNRSRGVRTTAILAGATTTNFLVEKAQSVLVASPEFVDFMSSQNLPETAKDYGFALLGAGVLLLQIRRKKN